MHPGHFLLARAGAAISQFDEDGNHLVTIRAPLPACLPQNAAAAERFTIVMGNSHLQVPSSQPYIGDCRSALTLATSNPHARSPSNVYGSLAREMFSSGLKLTAAKWVKAHTTASADASPQHQLDVKANAWVDTHAKRAALEVPIPPHELKAYDTAFRSLTSILKASARMLALWPNSKDLYGKLPRLRSTATPSDRAQQLVPHTFVWNINGWVCTVCLRRKYSPKAAIDRISCDAVTPPIARALKDPKGHRILLCSAPCGLMHAFCALCGYNASLSLRKLGQQCGGKKLPRPHSLRALFGNPSKHYQTGVLLSRCYSASSADVAFVLKEEPPIPPSVFPVVETVAAPSLHPLGAQGRPATGFDDPEWDMADPDEDLLFEEQ